MEVEGFEESYPSVFGWYNGTDVTEGRREQGEVLRVDNGIYN